VQPDFVLILASRAAIIHDRRIRGVPDLIVEVLSPGRTSYDEEVKKAAYAKAGVPEYAIINPATRQLKLFQLTKPGEYAEPRSYGESSTVMFNCLPTIPLAIRSLFAGAPDTTL
jgi:Uma2 family endonuclease